jgi:HrpA-like RNA helicase
VVLYVALDDDGCLTSPLGVNMAEFPLEPMLAKMLLVSGKDTVFVGVYNTESAMLR